MLCYVYVLLLGKKCVPLDWTGDSFVANLHSVHAPPVRFCRRVRACPAAGHVIRIWMPRMGAPHISRTPDVRVECVLDSACRGQGSSPVELFHQIQRLHAAARTSTSTQMHAHATQVQHTRTDGRTRGDRAALHSNNVRACPRGKS